MDRNAKRFAAAVLMPGEQVSREAEQVYSKLVRAAGFGDVAAVKKYLASQLAKQFEVSPQAMTIRLREWPMKIEDRVDQAMRAQLDYL
jgi:Zn-dependent peptidase ImmA (M78 family)